MTGIWTSDQRHLTEIPVKFYLALFRLDPNMVETSFKALPAHSRGEIKRSN